MDAVVPEACPKRIRYDGDDRRRGIDPKKLAEAELFLDQHDPTNFAQRFILAMMWWLLHNDTLPKGLEAGIVPYVNSGSSQEEIKAANKAAALAFSLMVQLNVVMPDFNVDFGNSAMQMPSQAYFLLHHNKEKGITIKTKSITDEYDTWLREAGFLTPEQF
jgi:hypothetical protein